MMKTKKNVEDFAFFEICNPQTIKGGKTKACITVEVKTCITTELKNCVEVEVHCPSPFSVSTDDGGSVGW